MGKDCCSLIVFFEEPFWVGIFEKISNGKLSVCKKTFGAEPKDNEVYEFIKNHYYDLQFSPAVDCIVKDSKRNPKRAQREIKKSINNVSIGTKSQQALKLQYEQSKQERKVRHREKKVFEAQQQFILKQQKKKEKHRGR